MADAQSMFRPLLSAQEQAPAAENTEDARRKIELALNIWQQSQTAAGSPVETYLRSRGLRLYPDMPIRFHPACPRGKVERLPAMVARMTDAVTGEPCGIHRTYIRPDGNGKAGIEPAKMMLGRATGAVVRLSPDAVTTCLGIAEGIENGLSVLGFGWAPVWVALSANGIRDFPVLNGIKALTIFADHDDAGLKAARACAAIWVGEGKEVIVRKPAKVGADWNDVVRKVQNG